MLTLIIFFVSALLYEVEGQGCCKNPYVAKRRLADDARNASPFYVIALPRTPKTLEIDNVCYTYFENSGGGFFHIMSVTYINGTNTYYEFFKEDIPNRMGIAEAKSKDCLFNDYTLIPICNSTVFVLYRCYLHGRCRDVDIGVTPGVDVRVTLAATPAVSPACHAEIRATLRDTSVLAGGDYVTLPQRLPPHCVTRYSLVCAGAAKALGPSTVSKEVADLRVFCPPPPPTPIPYPGVVPLIL